MTDKKPVGRPQKEGEKKIPGNCSLYPSVKEGIELHHGSITRFIEYCKTNDLIKIKKGK